jgi:hypothetical protein
MLLLQAILPSDVVNAGMFLAAPLSAAAAVVIARPPGRLFVAGFALAAFLWTVLMLIAVGLAALLIVGST